MLILCCALIQICMCQKSADIKSHPVTVFSSAAVSAVRVPNCWSCKGRNSYLLQTLRWKNYSTSKVTHSLNGELSDSSQQMLWMYKLHLPTSSPCIVHMYVHIVTDLADTFLHLLWTFCHIDCILHRWGDSACPLPRIMRKMCQTSFIKETLSTLKYLNKTCFKTKKNQPILSIMIFLWFPHFDLTEKSQSMNMQICWTQDVFHFLVFLHWRLHGSHPTHANCRDWMTDERNFSFLSG